MRKLVIYSAAERGIILKKSLLEWNRLFNLGNIELFFCDDDETKQNTKINGILCLAPSQCLTHNSRVYLVPKVAKYSKVRELELQLAEAKTHLNQMHSATFWRITKPLRLFIDFCRGL